MPTEKAHRTGYQEVASRPGWYRWVCTCGAWGGTHHRFKGYAEAAGRRHEVAKEGKPRV